VDNSTTDTFFNGKITVRQPRKGYRYSIDAIILACQVRPEPQERIVDLGTGCGIIPLIIARRYPEVRLVGVELQKDLAGLAEQNVTDNGFEGCIRILTTDLKTLDLAALPGPADMVVSNPPYYRVSSGRINPDRQRAIARHELRASLTDVLVTANRLLRTYGKFMCIYGAGRLVDLFCGMRSCGIEPKSARTIHAKSGEPARMALVEGVKQGNPELTVGPPLVIYENDGTYTFEVERMFTRDGLGTDASRY
jgi:tRNA1Val (adenine37-N6)-methyltransferase